MQCICHCPPTQPRMQACATCMRPLGEVPAPCYCPCCPLPAYCSAACQEADSFHRPGGPECGLPWTVLLPAEAVAALRLARRLKQEQGRGEQRHSGGQQQGGSGGGSAAASQVAALGAHFEELGASEAAQLAALAAVAHATWQQAAAESAAAVGAGRAAAAGGISAANVLDALCRLQVNGLAVVPPERRGSGDRLGLALYAVRQGPVFWGPAAFAESYVACVASNFAFVLSAALVCCAEGAMG